MKEVSSQSGVGKVDLPQATLSMKFPATITATSGTTVA